MSFSSIQASGDCLSIFSNDVSSEAVRRILSILHIHVHVKHLQIGGTIS